MKMSGINNSLEGNDKKLNMLNKVFGGLGLNMMEEIMKLSCKETKKNSEYKKLSKRCDEIEDEVAVKNERKFDEYADCLLAMNAIETDNIVLTSIKFGIELAKLLDMVSGEKLVNADDLLDAIHNKEYWKEFSNQLNS